MLLLKAMEEVWDSHFHFSLSRNGNPTLVEVNGILCTVSVTECLSILNMDREFKGDIYLFLGAHPWYVEGLDIGKIREVLERYRNSIFGLGEIGLDKRRGPNIKEQLAVLEQLFSMASQLALPVNLHCVRAFSDMLSLLRDFSIPRVVVHSFSGSLFYLEKFLSEKNCFISLSPFFLKRVDRLRELLSLLPLDRLLIETDYPYQAKDLKVWLDLLRLVARVKNYPEQDLLRLIKRNLLIVVGRYGSSESD